MEREIDRARRIPREDTLKDKKPANTNCIPFVVTFHLTLTNIGEILYRLHPVLNSSRRCMSAIKQVQMVAFRRPKILKDILVHLKMATPVIDKGCYKCGDRRCRVCDFLVECKDFRSRVTGNNFVINF